MSHDSVSQDINKILSRDINNLSSTTVVCFSSADKTALNDLHTVYLLYKWRSRNGGIPPNFRFSHKSVLQNCLQFPSCRDYPVTFCLLIPWRLQNWQAFYLLPSKGQLPTIFKTMDSRGLFCFHWPSTCSVINGGRDHHRKTMCRSERWSYPEIWY